MLKFYQSGKWRLLKNLKAITKATHTLASTTRTAYVSSFGKVQLMYVSFDTYFHFVYTSAHTERIQNILLLIASPNLTL